METIKSKLKSIDWNGHLNSENCNTNFETFHRILEETMNQEAPKKLIRISGKRRYSEPWMTTGIESSRKCQQLNKEVYTEATPQDIQWYKEFHNLFNRVKRTALQTYHMTKIGEYKNNTKKMWQLMNKTIGKCECTGSIIPYTTADGVRTYTPKIANAFGKFYSKMGSNLASAITLGKHSINEYLHNIPRSLNSLVLHRPTKEDIEQFIKALPNKSSVGFNHISNKMLKTLNKSLSLPTRINFQSIIGRRSLS